MRTHAQKRHQSQLGQSRDISRPNNIAINNRQAHPALQLKQTIGNQAAQRMLLSGSKGAPPIVNDVLHSPGQSLAAGTRSFMEARFGHDFSRVRIHTNDKAAKSAKAISAQAYTFGRDIVFGKGKYNPQTFEGKNLLAHELTHVVHQAQSGPAIQRKPEGSKSDKEHKLVDSYTDCDKSPYESQYVKDEVGRAFEHARDGNCIHNQALKDDLLSRFNGIKIKCSQDAPPGYCGEAKGSSSITLFKSAFNQPCPGLETTVFHEAVHLTQSMFDAHGSLPWDCQESCYPGSDNLKRGKASGCAYERGRRPFVSFSFGEGTTGKGPPLRYLRFYAGYEKRRWIASYIDLSAGVGLTYIGETKTGEPSDISSASTMVSVMSSLRIHPDRIGSSSRFEPYLGLSGALGIVSSGSNQEVGKEVAIAAGLRWYPLDFSVNVGVGFDATRETGLDKFYFVAATVTVTPRR